MRRRHTSQMYEAIDGADVCAVPHGKREPTEQEAAYLARYLQQLNELGIMGEHQGGDASGASSIFSDSKGEISASPVSDSYECKTEGRGGSTMSSNCLLFPPSVD